MKKVVSIITRSMGASNALSQPAECNYADNYYGDQVCISRSKA